MFYVGEVRRASGLTGSNSVVTKDHWIPQVRAQHPYPGERFDATHSRQEPYEGEPSWMDLCGGARVTGIPTATSFHPLMSSSSSIKPNRGTFSVNMILDRISRRSLVTSQEVRVPMMLLFLFDITRCLKQGLIIS